MSEFMELPDETKLYRIKTGFAQHVDLPIMFVAKPVRSTEKAVYLYGHGTTESAKTGRCMRCGRHLEHPVSVLLGIGPICGGHYWDWDAVGGMTEENLERLRGELRNIKVDAWVPKRAIKKLYDTEEIVEIPKDHPKLERRVVSSEDQSEERPKKIALLLKDHQTIKVVFPYNHTDIANVKTLTNRRWDAEKRVWTASLCIENVERLKKFGFKLSKKLRHYLKRSIIDINSLQPLDIQGLRGELYDFQALGVSFIENREGRALIGDEMGLGKTVQALAYLQHHPELRPAIIVCPASLKLNWEREVKKWISTKGTVRIINGTAGLGLKIKRKIKQDIIIVNYDILPNLSEKYDSGLRVWNSRTQKVDEIVWKRRPIAKTGWAYYLKKLNPKSVILDESHYIKNPKAERTKAIKTLTKDVQSVIALSGTPIVNRPMELFTTIKLLDSSIVPSYWDFARRYCGATHNGYGWSFNGASNTDELHDKLCRTIMIRRKKKDVLTQLPPKQRTIVPMKLKNRKTYERAEQDFRNWIRENRPERRIDPTLLLEDLREEDFKNPADTTAEALVKIEMLKQLCIKGKIKAACDWIQDHLDTNGKLVVFCTHKSTIKTLMKKFGHIAVRVDGSIKGEARQKAVDDFQTKDDVRLFVGNLRAAGVGITLTAASSVAFLELAWSPGEHDQAEDRIHRIGQEADSINAYYLLATNSIEDKITELLDKKRKILDSVLDGEETKDFDLLHDLLQDLRGE